MSENERKTFAWARISAIQSGCYAFEAVAGGIEYDGGMRLGGKVGYEEDGDDSRKVDYEEDAEDDESDGVADHIEKDVKVSYKCNIDGRRKLFDLTPILKMASLKFLVEQMHSCGKRDGLRSHNFAENKMLVWSLIYHSEGGEYSGSIDKALKNMYPYLEWDFLSTRNRIPSAAAVENERQRMEQDDELMPGGSLSLDNQEHMDELGTRISVENQDARTSLGGRGSAVCSYAETSLKRYYRERPLFSHQ